MAGVSEANLTTSSAVCWRACDQRDINSNKDYINTNKTIKYNFSAILIMVIYKTDMVSTCSTNKCACFLWNMYT